MSRATEKIDETELALWLYEKLWEPLAAAEDRALVEALLDGAPSVEPEHLTGWRADALRTYREEGRAGLIYRRHTGAVASLLRGYEPDQEALTRALWLLANRRERAALAARAIALRAELAQVMAALK